TTSPLTPAIRPTMWLPGVLGSGQRTSSPKPGVPRVSTTTTSPPASVGATEAARNGSSGTVHTGRRQARSPSAITARTPSRQSRPFMNLLILRSLPQPRAARRAVVSPREPLGDRSALAAAVRRQLARARAVRDLARGREEFAPHVEAGEVRRAGRVLVR